MNNSSDAFPSGKYTNCEVSRRLYRGAADAARRLDDHLRNALQQDILGSDVTSLRMRLKDYCERLLFSDPLEYGKKAEELMWRKVYYDFFQYYKHQKKKQRIPPNDNSLQNCLLAGIGNYHHLILRLQAEFQLNFENKIDVPFVWQQRGIKKERWKKHRRSLEIEDSSKVWAEQMCHRFLICLGDLSRYLSDAGDVDSSILAKRYYYQAFFLSPTSGMPLNQLGTLSGTKNYGCEALYYYMRCLLSQQPFDGVEGNLSLLFERNNETFKEVDSDSSNDVSNEVDLSKRFASRFLKLCEHFYYQKDENLQGLCQDVLKDFDLCLQNLLNKTENTEENEASSSFKKGILNEEIFFKIVIVSLVCFARLQQQGSAVVSAAAAFTLSLLSHVVRYCLKSLNKKLFKRNNFETSLNNPISNIEDEIGNSGTSGTVTPRTAVQTPINDTERLKDISNNQYNLSNPDKEQVVPEKNLKQGGPPPKKKLKKKSNRRTIVQHLRKVRRRRNCSSTSQEDSEDVSEGEMERHDSQSTDDKEEEEEEDEILEGTSDDEMANSDISETGSVYSSSEEIETEDDEDDDEEEDQDQDESGEKEDEDLGVVEESSNSSPVCNGDEIKEEESPETPKNCDKNHSQDDNDNIQKTEDDDDEKMIIEDSPDDIFDHVNSETLLAAIKVLSDWLKTNPEIISACAESSKPLWSRFVDLLNLLIKTESKLSLVKESENCCIKALIRESSNQKAAISWTQNHYLPEDLELQQLAPLVKAHNQIQENNSEKIQLSNYEQVILRVQCLIHFGFVLAECVNTGVIFDFELGVFEFSSQAKPSTNPNTPTPFNGVNKNLRHKNGAKIHGNANYSPGSPICGDIENDRKQLMRNMAHLWLKSEVKDLEKETRRGASSSNLSPYLVPDTTALCQHLSALRQLESAKRFILILPSVVISNLDLLKKDSQGAREAIRWIENELKRGSRFLRAQKQHERLSLVPMKYPKKKDKDSWDFFQILECCNYLSQQSANGGRDPAIPLVTLVTGNAATRILPVNASAIAKSSGVSMESVDNFVSKWRSSSKSQG